MWVAKAVLTYGMVKNENTKPKIEGRWDRQRIREYGPSIEGMVDPFM
jgi:hypothetical protein